VHSENIPYIRGEEPLPLTIRRKEGLGCFTFSVIVFFLIAFVGWSITIRDLIGQILLIQNPATTQGIVTKREIEEDSEDTTYHNLFYAFYVGDTRYEGEASVSEVFYNQHPENSTVDIAYVASDPGISRLSKDITVLNFRNAFFMFLLTCFFILIILYSYKENRKNHLLKRHGKLVRGQLLSITGKTDSEDDYILTLNLTFRTPDTSEIITTTRHIIADHLKDVALPTDRVPIYIFYASKDNWEVL
jgi:hypothetical protein